MKRLPWILLGVGLGWFTGWLYITSPHGDPQ